MTQYIIASCKSWHRKGFRQLQKDTTANWYWAGSPNDLVRLLDQICPRYIFFLHWNWIVPKSIWSAYESVCFHMTDVPYGRGGSPLQNLIVAGHKETKLTALRMVGEMDAGPVYTKKTLSLTGRAEEIYKRAGNMSFEIISWMVETEPIPTPQEGDAILFKRRTPSQSRLPETCDLEKMYDHIRMLDAPTYPLAFLEHGDFRLEFSRARLTKDGLKAQVTIRSTMQVKGDQEP